MTDEYTKRFAVDFKKVLDKLGCTSANQASLFAFGLHKFSSEIPKPNSVILKF